ncbi:ribosome biogenesis GTP-binding protein YihA/YsxC [Christensenellaceae bacterium OttesenSCG-928-K19]|nr:ribosome biogenesis GTP-binding protein YihA/YsxC [Christensenellaceae bacterium OttesenSCG-928-K19]
MAEQAELKLKKAVFYTSMAKRADYPGGDLPEIAFAGKSNVGKSSLINYLANNGKLAYVSKQPGKTRLVNYFLIDDRFYLVDLPGYGYAKVSKAEKKSWAELMQDYFVGAGAGSLRALMVLMDIRHNPTEGDLQMVEWAAYYGIPFAVIATKADKVAKSKRPHAAKKMKDYIVANTRAGVNFEVIPVSSMEKKGKERVLSYIQARLEEVR